jgi:Transposase DDE domain
MGRFFRFELHLVFNHQRQLVARKPAKGNVSDTTPVLGLTKNLVGKLFGGKGYLGKNWWSNCGDCRIFRRIREFESEVWKV